MKDQRCMTEEQHNKIENRLTKLEIGMAHVQQNSNDRLGAIMARFDKQDRLTGIVVGAIFTCCLTFGGIYLDAYLNKEEHDKTHSDIAALVRNDPDEPDGL